MNKRVANGAAVLVLASAISIACSSDNDSGPGSGGSSGVGGSAGTSSGGKGGSNSGGTPAIGGSAGVAGASGGESGAGSENAGAPGAGAAADAGAGGMSQRGEAGGGSDSGGVAGASSYSEEMLLRGTELVRAVSLCGGCHTPSGGAELSGNAAFKSGTLPAPNLTSHATGLGNWTDLQVINAIRNGVDNTGRHLDPAMPYWLFHNLSDADALAIVAFLRSLPPSSSAAVPVSVDATTVAPLPPSAFPDSMLQATDADYAAAQQGKYLLSAAAQCVKCHSPSASGLPAASFFSGVAPTSGTQIFSSNITPDATGLTGWTAMDIVTALKVGTNKAGTTLCGSMPSASKGYGGLTDADAHAIGVYLITIPGVSNSVAAPTLEPACP